MMLKNKIKSTHSRREIINWLLFEELHDKKVVLEIFEQGQDESFSGQLILKPFTFKWGGTTHEHVFTDGDYSGVIQFDPRNPTVHINYLNNSTKLNTNWTYHVESFIPQTMDDGVVHLILVRYPQFDIGTIKNLYNNLDDIKPEWMSILHMDEHPLTHLESTFDILAMLYEIDIDGCFMLTQLGQLVDFEISSRENT